VATGSELIAYLNYNKVSVGAPTAGYPYGSAVLVAGYGGPQQTTSSNAIIAYALKLDRAITDAEWGSLVQDPWQIFMPGQKRVISLPTFVSPWKANFTDDALYDDVDDTSTNDQDFIISPKVSATVTGDPVIFKLDKNLPQGLHTVRARAKKSETIGELRAILLDNNNLEVGTSAWQPLSNSFRTYDLAVVARDSASRVKFETIGSSTVNGIPPEGLVLYYDASNTLSYSGSGTVLTDLSGQKRDATFINGPIFMPENGGTINFDGIDDYATIAQPLGTLSQVTMIVWIKRRGNQPAWASIFWDRNSTTGYTGIGFRGDTINALTFSWTTYRVTGEVLEDNVWYMAALTRAHPYNVTGYTYGPSGIKTGVQSGYNGGDSNFNDLRLGIDGTISGRNFKGDLGIALMYNRALSAAEIDGIYNATKDRFKSYSGTVVNELITNGLVLHLDAGNTQSYPGSGTTWTDLSGINSSGELINSPTYNSSNSGYFQFATNTYARIPNSTALDTSTPSVEVWVKTNTTNQNGFWFEKGTVNTQYSLFQEGTAIKWRQNIVGAGVGTLSATTATYMNTSSWYQVVGTYTSGVRRLYINGILVNSDSQTGSLATSNGGMSIGAYGGYAGSRGYYYNGNLAICRVYNRALSAVEIQQNFNATRGRFGV